MMQPGLRDGNGFRRVTREGGARSCAKSFALAAALAACLVLAPQAGAAIKSSPNTAVAKPPQRAAAASPQVQALGGGAVIDDPGCSANVLGANDDGSTDEVTLPFTIRFFGIDYSSLWVNNNGNVTFAEPLSTYTPFEIDENTPPIIAPFFADVDTRGIDSNLVTYGTTTFKARPAFCVNWVGVGYYDEQSDLTNDFQLLIVDRSDIRTGSFDIVFNYDKIEWETGDASSGKGGFGGVSAGVGYSNGDGDPNHFYSMPHSLEPGAFLDGGPSSLAAGGDPRMPGRYVFAISGLSEGDFSSDLSGLERSNAYYGYKFPNAAMSGFLGKKLTVSDVYTLDTLKSIFGRSATPAAVDYFRKRTHREPGWFPGTWTGDDPGLCYGMALSGGRFAAGFEALSSASRGRLDGAWKAAGSGSRASMNLRSPCPNGNCSDRGAYHLEMVRLLALDWASQFAREVDQSEERQTKAYADKRTGVGSLKAQLASVMKSGIDQVGGETKLNVSAAPRFNDGRYALLSFNNRNGGHAVVVHSVKEVDGGLEMRVWDNNFPLGAYQDVTVKVTRDGSVTWGDGSGYGYSDDFLKGEMELADPNLWTNFTRWIGTNSTTKISMSVYPLYMPRGLTLTPEEGGTGVGSGSYMDLPAGAELVDAADGAGAEVGVRRIASATLGGPSGGPTIVNMPSGSGTVTISGDQSLVGVRGPTTLMTLEQPGGTGQAAVTQNAAAGTISTSTPTGQTKLTAARSGLQFRALGAGSLTAHPGGGAAVSGAAGAASVQVLDQRGGSLSTVTLYQRGSAGPNDLNFSRATVARAIKRARVRVVGGGVKVPVTCAATSTARCRFSAALTAKVKRRGSHGKKGASRTVRIGRRSLVVGNGGRKVLVVRLNRRGKALLRQRRGARARLIVKQGSAVYLRQSVRLR